MCVCVCVCVCSINTVFHLLVYSFVSVRTVHRVSMCVVLNSLGQRNSVFLPSKCFTDTTLARWCHWRFVPSTFQLLSFISCTVEMSHDWNCSAQRLISLLLVPLAKCACSLESPAAFWNHQSALVSIGCKPVRLFRHSSRITPGSGSK